MELPVIDISGLWHGGSAPDVVAALDRACSDTGFFVLEGHRITPECRAGVFDAARRLFAMSPEEKEAVAIGWSSCHRGYVGVARETLETIVPGAPADLKEAFDLSRDLGPDHPEVAAGTPLHGPNQWPEVEGFRSAIESYFDAAFAAALVLCDAMAAALGLPTDHFRSRMGDSVTNLRLLHYPPSTRVQPEPGQPGCGAHTDYGLVTMLAVDDVGGLEVMHRDGRWVDVSTSPDQLVVNIGDMMAFWSADRWVSTLHRVRTPTDRDRYSVPMFVNPDFRAVIDRPGSESGGSSITAGEYLLSRFDGTHAYRR